MDRSGDPVAALNAHAIAMGWGIRCYEDLHFVQPELNRLRDVWQDKARIAGWPSRAEMDARVLKPFLSHVSLLERVTESGGGRRYRLRLLGTAVAELLGEQTGRYLDEFLPDRVLPRWMMLYDTVLAGREPLRFVSRFEIPQMSYLDGEFFAAPLGNDGARPTLILNATYFTPKSCAQTAAE